MIEPKKSIGHHRFSIVSATLRRPAETVPWSVRLTKLTASTSPPASSTPVAATDQGETPCLSTCSFSDPGLLPADSMIAALSTSSSLTTSSPTERAQTTGGNVEPYSL